MMVWGYIKYENSHGDISTFNGAIYGDNLADIGAEIESHFEPNSILSIQLQIPDRFGENMVAFPEKVFPRQKN